MDIKILYDKILGCFNGKNIGGTLGAPLESKNGFFDVDYYIQSNIENNPVANDDLDLQLVWFNAVRRYGKNVNAEILSQYWATYINPSWAEYGVGKSNLRRGIEPPFSGYVGNAYKDSCGAFIRSEIWACLMPGHPELATRYAYFDACIDHADEGLYGEVFWAAIQSAAFVESDVFKLLEIGKSYIPQDCAISRVTDLMVKCYREKKTYEEARDILFKEIPGAFSYQHTKLADIKNTQYKPAKAGYDAPNNIGIAIMGWLYGEGDFGKSILYAANCGEDADCSAGTLAATLGIILGNKALPEKWVKPMGNIIAHTTINIHDGWMGWNPIYIPPTTTELTGEIIKCIPLMLPVGQYNITEKGLEVFPLADFKFTDKNNVYYTGAFGNHATEWFSTKDYVDSDHKTLLKDFSLFKVKAEYNDGFILKEGCESSISLIFYDNGESKIQRWLTVKAYSSDGIILKERVSTFLLANTNDFSVKKEFHFIVDNIQSGKEDIIFDIESEGQISRNLLKLTIFAE